MESGIRPDPERLLAEARLGRGESLGALLELYRNYLLLLARTQIDRALPGRAAPAALVQEAFLLAYQNFAQFRGQSAKEFLGWLRRILLNCLARLVEQQVLTRKRDI